MIAHIIFLVVIQYQIAVGAPVPFTDMQACHSAAQQINDWSKHPEYTKAFCFPQSSLPGGDQ